MRYKGKNQIKALIAAGLLTLGLSSCSKPIQGYTIPEEKPEIVENNKENEHKAEVEELIDSTEKRYEDIEEFKETLKEGFKKVGVTLDKASDEFVSSIVIDGTNVTIELVDGSQVSGTLYNLQIFDVNFENFYIYNSQYMKDYQNSDELYPDYREQGYVNSYFPLSEDYKSRPKLKIETKNCSVNNEYKRGDKYIEIDWVERIDYSNCRKVWLQSEFLEENQFSDMPNLETLVLINPDLIYLDEEVIKINSTSLKNLIIDGKDAFNSTDHFDLTGCPNLEVLSLPPDSQETNLDGLRGLKNLKQIAFGIPSAMKDEAKIQILEDFQNRIDLVSKPIPSDHLSLSKTLVNFISDISGINGSRIETLNISLLKRVSSESLLETVKSLPNLKRIVGFEINNAGMCSDELIEYCKSHGISHPFTEKSLEIKHKLQEIVRTEITEDMSEEDKIWALSKYIMDNMEYDHDLVKYDEDSSEDIKKGWGESLYYSVMEGEGVCAGYTMYAQNLFTEAGITSYKIDGIAHTWNLVEIDDEYYYVDLTNTDGCIDSEAGKGLPEDDLKEIISIYYMVPVEEEWIFYTYELPIEAEKRAKAAEEERKVREEVGTERIASIEVGKYMLQANRESLNERDYSELCGMIGILCALGLAKKVGDKRELSKQTKIIDEDPSLGDKEGVRKATSLKEAIDTLIRMEKEHKLRDKRTTAEAEREKNKKAKILEEETRHAGKEDSIR